jgi:hypothetical protein
MLDTVGNSRDFDVSIRHPEADSPSEISSNSLSNQRDAMRAERLAGSHQIALSHVHGSRRSQCGEHAGPSSQPGRDPIGPGTRLGHEMKQPRYGGLRKLGGVAIEPGQSR